MPLAEQERLAARRVAASSLGRMVASCFDRTVRLRARCPVRFDGRAWACETGGHQQGRVSAPVTARIVSWEL